MRAFASHSLAILILLSCGLAGAWPGGAQAAVAGHADLACRADCSLCAPQPLQLTAAEQQWRDRHRVIRVAVPSNSPPFAFFENEHYQGMAWDYLQTIGQRLGISFQPLSAPVSTTAALDLLETPEGAELVLTVPHNVETDGRFLLTRDYLLTPQVIFTRQDHPFISGLKDLTGKMVLVEAGYFTHPLASYYPGITLQEVPGPETGLQRVADGLADAYVGSLAAGSYLLQQRGLANIKVAASAGLGDLHLAMGVRNDWPELVRLIDKALASMPDEEHRVIQGRWLAVRYEHGIRPQDIFLWGGVAVFLSLGWIFSLRRLVMLRTAALEDEVVLRAGKEAALKRENERRQEVELVLREKNEQLLTTREQLEEQLAENQAAHEQVLQARRLLQTVMDTTHHYQGLLTPDGRVVDMNRAALALAGTEKVAILGRYFWDTPWWNYSPELQAQLRDGVARCAEGEYVRFEASRAGASGALHTVDFSLTPLADAAGSVIYLIPEGRDITRRKQLEATLRKLSEAVEQSPACIAITDRQGILEYVNPEFCRLTGYTADEVLGQNPRILKSGLTPAAEHQRLWTTITAGKVWQGEFCNRKKNGELYWEAARIAPIVDGQGTISHFVAVKEDITARKRDAEALRRSKERLRQLFDQHSDGIVLLRCQGLQVLDANPAALSLYQVDRDEVVGGTLWPFFARQEFRRFLREVRRSDTPQGVLLERVTTKTRDGREIIVSLRGKLMTVSDEQVVYCSIRDITERLRIEAEIQATQAQLIQANKMTSLGMLVSSIAHEINNPNNFISVNAKMLADVWPDLLPVMEVYRQAHGEFTLGKLPAAEMAEVVPRLLEGIVEGSQRISSIIDNMRDFVRSGSDSQQLPFDLNRTVQAAATILWQQIHKQTDHFRLELGEGLPPLRGNAQQVEQVVINLVANALQALPDKARGVLVRTSLDSCRGELSVLVQDQGCGMSAEVLARVQEPFFTTRMASGGTGLGLYISAAILKKHGGSLTFTSQPGAGTSAVMRLPIPGEPER